jgi:hypothetical protein
MANLRSSLQAAYCGDRSFASPALHHVRSRGRNSRSPMPIARTPGAIHDPQWKVGTAEPCRETASHASLIPRTSGDLLKPLLDLLVPPTETRGTGLLQPTTASTADELVRLVPPRKLSLDEALEFLHEDECIEVTPDVVRLRKVSSGQVSRVKLAHAAKRGHRRRFNVPATSTPRWGACSSPSPCGW